MTERGGMLAPDDVIDEVLASTRRMLGLRRTAGWTIRGLLAGAVLAGTVLLVGHATGLPEALALGAAVLAAGSLVGAGYGVCTWPGRLETARLVDARFELKDRLTTALELKGSSGLIASLQRSDVAERIQRLELREAAQGIIRPAESGAAAVLIAVVVVLGSGLLWAALPNPSATASTGSPSTPARNLARHSLPRIIHQAHHGLAVHEKRNPTLHRLEALLRKLQHQLQIAHNKQSALKAMSRAERRLQHLRSSLHAISPSALRPLARSLRSYLTKQERSALGKGNGAALRALAKALSRLARQTAHLSRSQRAALARALAQAADQTADLPLRSLLRRSAAALAGSKPQQAAQLLKQASQALQRSPQAKSTQRVLSSIQSQLSSLQQSVSSLKSGSQGNVLGGQPKGPTQGFGQGSQAFHAAGHGKGLSRSGQAANGGKNGGTSQGGKSGRGRGRPGQTGSGKGSPGAHGSGGGHGGPGAQKSGKYGPSVYVSGHIGRGPRSTETGPNGQPLPGSRVPYRQVIAGYQQTARAALDQSSLPPSLRAYVRAYFSSISH